MSASQEAIDLDKAASQSYAERQRERSARLARLIADDRPSENPLLAMLAPKSHPSPAEDAAVLHAATALGHAHRFGAAPGNMLRCECGVTVLHEELERIGFVQNAASAAKVASYKEENARLKSLNNDLKQRQHSRVTQDGERLYGDQEVKAAIGKLAVEVNVANQRANRLADECGAMHAVNSDLERQLANLRREYENLAARKDKPKPEPFVYMGKGRRSNFP